MGSQIFVLALLYISFCIVLADNASLQDFCVADTNSSVRVNGLACKDPKLVDADDFFYTGLQIAGNTTNIYGTVGMKVFATELRGLNSLGISMARLDFAPWGVNPPHVNPRASEIFTVLEGTVEVAFITSNPENKLMTKILQTGDVWVNPQGLIHYQRNVGNCSAVALQGFNSQDPGLFRIANNVIGSNPSISSSLLAKAFQVDKKIINEMQSKVLDKYLK